MRVPVGQAQVVPTGKIPLLVPWDKSYTHAGDLSLSRDKLYTHDGGCPSSTCPLLSHKVGLQGRAKFPFIFCENTILQVIWPSPGTLFRFPPIFEHVCTLFRMYGYVPSEIVRAAHLFRNSLVGQINCLVDKGPNTDE